ncbi:glycosyltransferase [soil metagenome]
MKLRILQIFNRYLEYGGEEGSVYRIGDALQELHDVEYFLSSTKDFLKAGKIGKIAAGIEAWHNWEAAARLDRYQKIGRFDAWQIHNVFPALSPSVYRKAFQLGVPIVHYLHNYRLSCTNGFFLNHGKPCQRCIGGNFLPALETACWRDSHLFSGYMGAILHQVRSLNLFEKTFAWIALSEAQKTLHVKMGIPEGNIHVIPHFFQPADEPLAPNPKGDVLFVGRLSAEKGVLMLLEAWKLADSKGRDLVIMGDGPERKPLEQYIEKHRVPNVRFTGFLNREKQRSVIEKSAFMVTPSIWEEPFGMVVLESWSNTRPVVATRIGALEELITPDKTGLLAEKGDAEDLARQISSLIAQPDKVLEMGLAGLAELQLKYTKDLWKNRIDTVYSKIRVHATS